MARPSRGLPKDLAAARHRIDAWRTSNTTRRRIPESMWADAIALARVHGVNPVSEAMRLSHERLRKRVSGRPKTKRRDRAPRFVQIAPIEMAKATSRMSIDLVDGSGRSMTLRGATARDVSGIVAAFFGGDPR